VRLHNPAIIHTHSTTNRCGPTFTLEALSQQTPEQRATVIAEGEHLEVVDAELVGHVHTEPLGTDGLRQRRRRKKR
jgi:hypothetical protein